MEKTCEKCKQTVSSVAFVKGTDGKQHSVCMKCFNELKEKQEKLAESKKQLEESREKLKESLVEEKEESENELTEDIYAEHYANNSITGAKVVITIVAIIVFFSSLIILNKFNVNDNTIGILTCILTLLSCFPFYFGFCHFRNQKNIICQNNKIIELLDKNK